MLAIAPEEAYGFRDAEAHMSEKSDFRLVGVVVLTVATGIWGGCSEPIPELFAPRPGSVDVTTTTIGEDVDLNGYIVSVDGGVGPTIDVNGAVTVSELRTGEHQLALTDVAPNCAVEGDNPRTMVTGAAAPVQTTFRVNCWRIFVLTMVSGQGQVGQAGTMLDEPFVVRVTNSEGEAVEDVEVHWAGTGALEGRFDENGDPVTTTSTHTDANGLTQVSFMPTSFGVISVNVCVADCRNPSLTFTAGTTDPEATIAILSGNDQQGKAG